MKDVELRIDFAAALAKLAPAQLQGTWQLPTELARLAIAAGAESVELELAESHLTFAASGARLEDRFVFKLAHVLNVKSPASRRHEALVSLEGKGGLALAALAAFGFASLELVSGNGWTLRARSGERPRLLEGKKSHGFMLIVEGLSLDARAAVKWLEKNGRFAPIPIRVDKKDLARGFRRPLIRMRLREPLPAALAIAEKGEVPRLWLLRHGIISTRATIPGYPAFEAAVEMSSIAAPGATSSALREAVQPYLEALVQAAVGLIGQLAGHAAGLREDARQRAARLLLEASRRPRFRRRLERIRVFPTVAPDNDSRLLLSLAELEARIRIDDAGRRLLDALATDQAPRDFALGGSRILTLGAGERALLGDRLDVAFATPPQRPRPRRSPRHLIEELRARVAFAWYGWRGQLLAEDELSSSERGFLAALRRHAAVPWTVLFHAGTGRVYLTADGRLLLPRRNPVVRSSVRSLERDPSWLYPTLVALLGGRDLPAAEIRNAWLAGSVG